MLERLEIENFQAHNKLVIDFDPHVTTIVGPSDVGKSAVIRALQWLFANQPLGDSFIRHGTNVTSVMLDADGHKITRRKGGSINEYTIDDKVYKSFRTLPPDPATAITQHKNDLTFQSQHDAPFWFSSTAGQVGRALNAVTDMNVMDESLSAVGSELRGARRDVDTATTALEEAKTRRKTLEWVPAAEASHKHCQKTRADLDAIRGQLGSLRIRSDALLSKQRTLRLKKVDLSVSKADLHLTETTLQLITLRHKLLEMRRLQTTARLVIPPINELTQARDTFKTAHDRYYAATNKLETHTKLESKLCQAQTRLQPMIVALEKFGKRCPTCGQPNPIRQS